MIEIIILYNLSRRIGINAREKGRKAFTFQLLLILFWFGFELGGAIISGVAIMVILGDKASDHMFYTYFAALFGAALGAWVAFEIVRLLPDSEVEVELPTEERNYGL